MAADAVASSLEAASAALPVAAARAAPRPVGYGRQLGDGSIAVHRRSKALPALGFAGVASRRRGLPSSNPIHFAKRRDRVAPHLSLNSKAKDDLSLLLSRLYR